MAVCDEPRGLTRAVPVARGASAIVDAAPPCWRSVASECGTRPCRAAGAEHQLRRPPCTTSWYERGLLEQIGQRFSVPLTTVVAGAGFGKSTLLAQAIRANRADPCGIDAWVSCEADDGDAEHLARAVLAALDCHSDRGDPAQRVLGGLGQLAPLDICVVFDDVHEVADGTSGAALLADLVRALPPHVHLVFSGRRPPPVPLARLRAAGQVIDVAGADLAFTDDEAAALAELDGCEPSRLAGLSALSGWPSLVRLWLSAPAGSAPQQLLEEIVAALPPADRRALLALGTLGWGTAADVQTVAGDESIDLSRVADTVPLVHRDEDGWYEVHHLWEDAVERIFSGGRARRAAAPGPRAVRAARRNVAHRMAGIALG